MVLCKLSIQGGRLMDKTKFTPELISELKGFYVERVVDNMDTKDLVNLSLIHI